MKQSFINRYVPKPEFGNDNRTIIREFLVFKTIRTDRLSNFDRNRSGKNGVKTREGEKWETSVQ